MKTKLMSEASNRVLIAPDYSDSIMSFQDNTGYLTGSAPERSHPLVTPPALFRAGSLPQTVHSPSPQTPSVPSSQSALCPGQPPSPSQPSPQLILIFRIHNFICSFWYSSNLFSQNIQFWKNMEHSK